MTGHSDLATSSMPRRRRKPIFLLVAVPAIVLCCLWLAVFLYFRYVAVSELKAAIAEIERQDPDWLLESLEANRAVIPEERNAAIRVLTAQRLFPPQWPSPPAARFQANTPDGKASR